MSCYPAALLNCQEDILTILVEIHHALGLRFLLGISPSKTCIMPTMNARIGLRKGLVASLVLALLLACGLSACTSPPAPTLTQAIQVTALPPTQTDTPLPPSATPIPAVAYVNGEAISLSAYQAELERFQAALGTQLATEDQEQVLNSLIDDLLLAQAAAAVGFVVDEALLQERYDRLVAGLGSQQALLDWMVANRYTDETFRQDLARSIAAAWMRDQIIAEVPEVADQIHARQILLYNSDEANQALAELRAGADFADLAAQFDPLTKGELGWFPRGYLIDPAVEQAAFELRPGDYSQVIETPSGFRIVQVLERDAQRPLSPDAKLVLQEQALGNWLARQREQSEIQILTE
jgi:peptidyl-prolyl cis-trans isomerase C